MTTTMATIEQAAKFRQMVERVTELEQRIARCERMGDERRAESYRGELAAVRRTIALMK